jgi:hypothetical protein
MQLKVLDGNAVLQTLLAKGLEAPVDHSGIIAATGVAQVALAANLTRSGWFFQNVGASPMRLNDVAAATAAVVGGNGSFVVAPGATFPPDNFPISTAAISVMGTINDTFVIREW